PIATGDLPDPQPATSNPGRREEAMRLLGVLGAATLAVVACQVQPEPGEGVGHSETALSAEQCSYYAVNGKVTICHATSSKKNPVVKMRVAEEGCINGH